MTTFVMKVVKTNGKSRKIVNSVTYPVAMSHIDIAKALAGEAYCKFGRDGSQRWHGKKDIDVSHRSDTKALEEFIEGNLPDTFFNAMVSDRQDGWWNRSNERAMYCLEWY